MLGMEVPVSILEFLWENMFTVLGYSILAGGALAELLYLYIVVFRAYDVEYDETECNESWPKIDLKKALRRRLSIPRLGFPLWLVFSATLGLWLLRADWDTYIAIAVLWFLTTPLRKMLGIAVARKAYRDSEHKATQTSYWDDVMYYYSWAFDPPEAPGGNRPWFKRRLKWMNKFQSVLRFFWYLIQVWRLWGMLVMAVVSMFWPIAALCAIFYHVESVDEYKYWRPWWRFDRKGTRPHRKPTIDGEVVKTEPGDESPDGLATRKS